MKGLALLLALVLALGVFWILRAPAATREIAEAVEANAEPRVEEAVPIDVTPPPVKDATRAGVRVPEHANAVEADAPDGTALALEPRQVAITGTLVDQDWTPVPEYEVWLVAAEGFEVRALSFAGEATATARTDGAGRFAFANVSPGIWWIGPAISRSNRKVRDENALAGLPVAVEVTEGSIDPDVLVQAYRGLSVAGRVLDPDDRPVKEVLVVVSGTGGVALGFTDADGAFDIGPLAPGICKLSAQTTFSGFAPPELLEVEAGKRDVVLRMRLGGSLRGRVSNASGDLVSGSILLSCPSGSVWFGTVAEGSFAFEGLAPGPYSLAAAAGGSAAVAKDVVVRAGEVQDAVFLELEPAARLRVRFTGGKSVRQLRATLDGVIVAADGLEPGADTTFVVPEGRISVALFVPDWESSEEQAVVTVAGEEREVVFE